MDHGPHTYDTDHQRVVTDLLDGHYNRTYAEDLARETGLPIPIDIMDGRK